MPNWMRVNQSENKTKFMRIGTAKNTLKLKRKPQQEWKISYQKAHERDLIARALDNVWMEKGREMICADKPKARIESVKK